MLEKLLSTPTAQLGRVSRFIVFQVKLWSHCVRLLRANRAGQRAAALSYQTIFGIVPLAIVMLLIFQGLQAYSDIGDKIKNFIYDQANLSAFQTTAVGAEGPGRTVSLTEHLDHIVDKFFTGASKGVISLVSVVFVIWAAFALLSTVEKAFNDIYHVGRPRGFLHRIINYWAVLTLGPLLIAAGIYATTRYSPLAALVHIQQTIFASVAPLVLSYLVTTVMLFLLYFILPNTRVQARSAIWGAAVAAVVWIAAKNLYGYCVTELGLYRTVYGVLALIPVTVLWIYITWLIVLFGLQLTFTTQHLKTLDDADMATAEKRQQYFIANDFTVISILRHIAEAFEQDRGPLSGEAIYGRLNLPGDFGEKILDHLVHCGLVVRTSEPTVGYLPARDPAHIRLSDISEAVSKAGFAQPTGPQPDTIEQISRQQQEMLSRYNLGQIIAQKAGTT